MFHFICPTVKKQPELVRICRLCKSSAVIIKQTLPRSVKDSVAEEVEILRLYCKSCRYSFRVYPEGVRAYSARTKRLVFLGVILYAAGLSYEKCCGFLEGMVGRKLESFVTIWRDVQTIGEQLRKHSSIPIRMRKQVIVGVDGTYVKVLGKEQGVLLAANAATGTTITIGLQNEWKERELKQFISEVGKRVGMKHIKGLVSDDLDTYKVTSRSYRIIHQVCLAHAKKNLHNRLLVLKKQVPEAYITKLKQMLAPPKKDNIQTVKELLTDEKIWIRGNENKQWKSYRLLLTDLLRNWDYYTAYLTDSTLPQTNNRCEQAFARSKIRYKLTRGFKSTTAVLNFFMLTQYTGMHQFQIIADLC